MEGKQPRGISKVRRIGQIRRDIEMRGGNWEEIQENRKGEKRKGWRFLYNFGHDLRMTMTANIPIY